MVAPASCVAGVALGQAGGEGGASCWRLGAEQGGFGGKLLAPRRGLDLGLGTGKILSRSGGR